jgi:hypothetical protein
MFRRERDDVRLYVQECNALQTGNKRSRHRWSFDATKLENINDNSGYWMRQVPRNSFAWWLFKN